MSVIECWAHNEDKGIYKSRTFVIRLVGGKYCIRLYTKRFVKAFGFYNTLAEAKSKCQYLTDNLIKGTVEEFIYAVDLSNFLLKMDSCKQYGLMEGGVEINADRCLDLIEQAKCVGVVPDEDFIEWNLIEKPEKPTR